MRALKVLLVMGLAVVLAACGKPLPPEKAAYAGLWTSQHMQLEISKGGTVRYERRVENSRQNIDGPIQEFIGDDFTVGIGPISTRFKVSKPPHQVGDEWKMTVDGLVLTRTGTM